MGAYYTITRIGIDGSAVVTFTHSLSITPANLVARLIRHQVLATITSWQFVETIGTNVVTVGSTTGTLVTCDLEVQHIHSISS